MHCFNDLKYCRYLQLYRVAVVNCTVVHVMYVMCRKPQTQTTDTDHNPTTVDCHLSLTTYYIIHVCMYYVPWYVCSMYMYVHMYTI